MCCGCSGEARVYAEVHPDTVCLSVAACQFSVKGGNKETVRVQARPEVPFGALSEKPQLRECFIFCTLPAPGSELEEVVIEDKDGQTLATWPVEVSIRLRSIHWLPYGYHCCCVGSQDSPGMEARGGSAWELEEAAEIPLSCSQRQ